MNTPKFSGTRRDAVVFLAYGFVGIGGLAALWPLVDQLNPNGSSARDGLEVDLGAFDAASLKLVRLKGEPSSFADARQRRSRWHKTSHLLP
jgi:ubiquinol-cytochrome c reductase iron-sulfur subunit